MIRRLFLVALIVPVAAAVHLALTPMLAQEATGKPRKVIKTDAQWMKQLTLEQFMVTRRKATEPAFSGKYATGHPKSGTFVCVCCGAPLFSPQAKFDSGTGWPSFWRPIDPKRIETAPDYEGGEPRVEVRCVDCGAHLGHVFPDGPPPTGLRYCINSVSLKLATGASATQSTKKPAKGKSKSSAKKAADSESESAPAEKSGEPKSSSDEPKAASAKDDGK
jgi:peptide-methionine (R)-S-oxide reductase